MPQIAIRLAGFLVLLWVMSVPAYGSQAPAEGADAVHSVRVNGVQLHYIERGRGEPLVLVHGGQGDYRSWAPQLAAFSMNFRVVSYSRRFNYPNRNPLTPDYRSAYSDADDLAALIRGLELGPVHLVGTSAGALAALLVATEHPALVRSVVLAEPPVHAWARSDARGKPLYQAFMTTIWNPAGAAFRAGDEQAAMRRLVDGFGGDGRFDALPSKARESVMQNAAFFRIATASSDPFPEVSKPAVRRLRMPVLIVTGEHTLALHKFVNDALASLLPLAQRVTIPNAGHGSPRENPEAFNRAVEAFLLKLPARRASSRQRTDDA